MTACQVLPDHRLHRRKDTFSSHADACRTPSATVKGTLLSVVRAAVPRRRWWGISTACWGLVCSGVAAVGAPGPHPPVNTASTSMITPAHTRVDTSTVRRRGGRELPVDTGADLSAITLLEGVRCHPQQPVAAVAGCLAVALGVLGCVGTVEVREVRGRLLGLAELAADADPDVPHSGGLGRVRLVELDEHRDVLVDPAIQPGCGLAAGERVVGEQPGEVREVRLGQGFRTR